MNHPQAALGFRVWTIESDGQLQSTVGRTVWRQGENRAQCSQRLSLNGDIHTAPAPGCQCGFHAYHRFVDAFDHSDKLWRVLGLTTVVGVIAASGKLEIHHDGFRAQLAEPLALLAENRHHPSQLFRAADHYSLPLLSREEITDEANYENVITIPLRDRPEKSSQPIEERPDAS